MRQHRVGQAAIPRRCRTTRTGTRGWLRFLSPIRGLRITTHFVSNAANAPAVSGAYLLLVTLPNAERVVLPGRSALTLSAGRFLYAGSARGPGGLRARLARHQRTGKSLHWHIDRLTAAGTMQGAWIVPGGDECAIIAALAHLPVPLPGFGSTDCRRCASHLLAWPAGTGDVGEVLDASNLAGAAAPTALVLARPGC